MTLVKTVLGGPVVGRISFFFFQLYTEERLWGIKAREEVWRHQYPSPTEPKHPPTVPQNSLQYNSTTEPPTVAQSTAFPHDCYNFASIGHGSYIGKLHCTGQVHNDRNNQNIHKTKKL